MDWYGRGRKIVLPTVRPDIGRFPYALGRAIRAPGIHMDAAN